MNPKPKKDGRFKMRLLVRGDTKPDSWSVGPIDSPVASMDSIRTLVFSGELSDEAETIATIDVKNAFRQSVNFSPDEEPRYVAYKAHKQADLRVFKLLGSLYGSKDAAMQWFNTLSPFLQSIGFQQGQNDKALFYNPKTKVRIAGWVDDLVVRGPKRHIKAVFQQLSQRFQLKPPQYLDEESEIYFVGMRLRQMYKQGVKWYSIDQERDILAFLDDAGVHAARGVSAPMPNKNLISADTTPLSSQKQSQYRFMIGSLQYFVCGTQWHLAHCVARLGQFNSAATKGAKKQLQWNGVFKILT